MGMSVDSFARARNLTVSIVSGLLSHLSQLDGQRPFWCA